MKPGDRVCATEPIPGSFGRVTAGSCGDVVSYLGSHSELGAVYDVIFDSGERIAVYDDEIELVNND